MTKNLHDGSKILDIGCGNGRFLKYLLNFGNFELFGIELEGNSAKRAAQIPEINLKIGTLKNDDFPENTFDAISMFHVFEHLTEPRETLTIINKILKPGGNLTMSFPNIDSFQSKLFKGKWLHLDPPRHLFFFKPNDFIELMKLQGYKLVQTNFISLEQNPYGWVQSILNCLFSKREVLFESLKGNKQYAKDISGFSLFIQKVFFVLSFPIFILFDLLESIFGKGGTVEFKFKML
ncbi:methyltransferase domain-containing protein [Bacteroidota bacterium]